jgi:aminoglycoside phosphotransferase
MPMTSTDLSLSDAELILRDWLGKPTDCTFIDRLHGGMCSSVFALGFDAPPYSAVVKLAEHSFTYEVAALEYLERHSELRVPAVYRRSPAGQLLTSEILVIEKLPGVNLEQAQMSPAQRRDVDRQLANMLLELHSHQHETYGSVSSDEPYAHRP